MHRPVSHCESEGRSNPPNILVGLPRLDKIRSWSHKLPQTRNDSNKGSIAIEFIIAFITATIALFILITFILFCVSSEVKSFADYMEERAQRIVMNLPIQKSCEDNPITNINPGGC